jgi:hypothetical protein
MTMGVDDSEFGGFGYSRQHDSGSVQAADAVPASANEAVAEEVISDSERNQIPGLEASASDCFNRANQIARSLNHTNLSIDHLMLALTMDPSARRLLERVADIGQLRDTAMQRLGKNYTRSSRDVGEQLLPPTSDLADLGKVAREAAAEREQLIAVSDLINAFPKANGRMTYGITEVSPTEVIDSLKNGLVPKVDDAVTRIEAAVRDAIQQQHQSVNKLLEDLSAGQIARTEERQREFMDDIRRQVREVAEAQIGAAVKEINDKLEIAVATLLSRQPQVLPIDPTEPPKPKNWNWLSLF